LLALSAGEIGAEVVVLNNGDRITGDIKRLEYGTLHVEPDYADNVFQIDWDEVAGIETENRFIAELSSGQRVAGLLRTVPGPLPEVVIGDQQPVRLSEVVVLEPVEHNFWGRFGISVEGGFDFAKTKSSQSTRLATSLDYTADRWSAEASLSVNRKLQDDAEPARRKELASSYRRYLNDPWFAAALANLLKNDEQRLQLRTSFGGAVGRPIRRTNRAYFGFLTGAAWTNELYEDPEVPRTNSAEGLAALEYNAFNIGDLTFLTKLIVYPSLSQRGRVRADFSLSLKWNLPSDLYVSTYFWDNYDSKPLNDASKNDFAVGTSIGWDF